ncbi:MAG TPA: hypothetical protein VH414_21645 [Lichenihabitans sp.]|jgi:hypothetical protein|nr:hypothetical protein [Lichenihabitans sp.]
MRFLFGLVVGALLVVGAAYVHDASVDPTRSPGAQTMVNWPVVSENLRGLNGWLQDRVSWLSQQLHRMG